MTLTTETFTNGHKEVSHERKCEVGTALIKTIELAVTDSRLVCGTFQSADMLSTCPESITLCILPDYKEDSDVSILIQHKLIEAYCWENDIPVIKVNGVAGLQKVVSLKNDQNNNANTDLSCLLIQDKEKMEECEEMLSKYYWELINDNVDPHPVIDLPV
ncbi:hypothetical protein FSP39_006480 [Pinctada imbricata]|uniref:Ribosomal protein L7Ae/L30e/S12e/Gadd45 domain-containing protein n=1 Tax=Pinctada imbricata TaxID=66713 RepID=A0AA88XXH1_PINIB|nr:hypothetical protein FSP39_006480 [Pinctada imbricata]